MSRFNHHYLAMLPLFTVLTMSPADIQSKFASRSIASEVAVSHPKYEARAAKIDRTKIEIDKDLDLTCFSERGEALRTNLMQQRKDYKVDLVEKDGVAAQRAQIEGLVSSLVSLEVDFKALKDKKAFEPEGEKIAEGTINELKTTLESLLIDELENELNVLKAEVKKEETPPVVKEEPKLEDIIKEQDKQICELEDKNKAMNKQIEELMEQQKSILDTMLGMNRMMVQMHSQMQQQSAVPEWMRNGSMMNYQMQYPYNHGTTIIMVGGQAQGYQPNVLTQQPQMGQNTYQQSAQSPQYQLPQPGMQSYMSQNPYMDVDLRYSMPQPVMPGSFGNAPFMYNFGPTLNNLPSPMLTASLN